MTKSEDEALIERLARAACEAIGYDPDELEGPAAVDLDRPRWKRFVNVARRHIAMQRELERARATPCDHDFIDGLSTEYGTQQFCRKCGHYEWHSKDTDQ